MSRETHLGNALCNAMSFTRWNGISYCLPNFLCELEFSVILLCVNFNTVSCRDTNRPTPPHAQVDSYRVFHRYRERPIKHEIRRKLFLLIITFSSLKFVNKKRTMRRRDENGNVAQRTRPTWEFCIKMTDFSKPELRERFLDFLRSLQMISFFYCKV